MPVKGVDEELALVFQEEAQVSRLMGGQYYELAALLKHCDNTAVDNCAYTSQEFINLSNRNEKVYYARLGELRLVGDTVLHFRFCSDKTKEREGSPEKSGSRQPRFKRPEHGQNLVVERLTGCCVKMASKNH